MSKIMVWCTGLVVAGVLGVCGQAAAGVAAGGSWGRVIEVPGLAALNTGKGGGAGVSAVSCGSPGNCAAGGGFGGRPRHPARVGPWRARRAGKRTGGRGRAGGGRQETGLPGLTAMSGGGGADVGSLWCASAGNCVAGGSYADGNGSSQGFVAAERNGRWGKATRVPGLAALNKGGDA